MCAEGVRWGAQGPSGSEGGGAHTGKVSSTPLGEEVPQAGHSGRRVTDNSPRYTQWHDFFVQQVLVQPLSAL